ncbi:MAG: acyltransferase family protein [Clostridia bacterium]|nr:acyltransferase family protein [Clostridia bacterium]
MILHISAQNWHDSDIHSFEWNTFNFYDSIVRWGVPVFTMISGSLFLNGTQSIERIYKKNILRIITAFIFWSMFYAIIIFVRGGSLKSALASFISGYYHMWFLFMIVGLYMIIPFLRVIIKNDFLTRYFLFLALIFAFIFPQFISIISVGFDKYGSFIQSVIDNINMKFVLGYTFYFVLGYYINKISISSKQFRILFGLGILGFFTTIISSMIVTNYTNEPNGMFYGNFTLNVMLEAIFIFIVVKQSCKRINFSEKAKLIIFKLSKYSFGAYLIHAFWISAINKILGLNTLSFNSFLAVPIIGVLVFILSFGVSAMFNHIPILNKYIV